MTNSIGADKEFDAFKASVSHDEMRNRMREALDTVAADLQGAIDKQPFMFSVPIYVEHAVLVAKPSVRNVVGDAVLVAADDLLCKLTARGFSLGDGTISLNPFTPLLKASVPTWCSALVWRRNVPDSNTIPEEWADESREILGGER